MVCGQIAAGYQYYQWPWYLDLIKNKDKNPVLRFNKLIQNNIKRITINSILGPGVADKFNLDRLLADYQNNPTAFTQDFLPNLEQRSLFSNRSKSKFLNSMELFNLNAKFCLTISIASLELSCFGPKESAAPMTAGSRMLCTPVVNAPPT